MAVLRFIHTPIKKAAFAFCIIQRLFLIAVFQVFNLRQTVTGIGGEQAILNIVEQLLGYR
jgi:hypothetical protein